MLNRMKNNMDESIIICIKKKRNTIDSGKQVMICV